MATPVRYRSSVSRSPGVRLPIGLGIALTLLIFGFFALRDYIHDYGFTDSQLAQVKEVCTHRAEVRSASKDRDFDDVFVRCESVERTPINADRFLP